MLLLKKFHQKKILLRDLVVLLESAVLTFCAQQVTILICYPCTYLNIKSINDWDKKYFSTLSPLFLSQCQDRKSTWQFFLQDKLVCEIFSRKISLKIVSRQKLFIQSTFYTYLDIGFCNQIGTIIKILWLLHKFHMDF